MVQAPAPERAIAGGLATPALLAPVLISKYCDYTPLYGSRRSLPTTALISAVRHWPAGSGVHAGGLEALHERLCKNVFTSNHLFADDTPVPVLDPGRGLL